MSRYPEADEAQHGHYNDGYNPYPTYNYEPQQPPNPYELQPTPNPYEHEHQAYQPIHADPFVGSQSPPHPSLYRSPPPLHDPFTNQHAISPPPLHQSPPLVHPGSPPLPLPHPNDYLNPGYGGMHSITPPPMQIQPSPVSLYDTGPALDALDEQEEGLEDAGDYPLLRRDRSHASSNMPIPGEYEPVAGDDRSESNIRYGRIPQRVPRRYKTIKKVE